MIDIRDKTYRPSLPELAAFIENPLFSALCARMEAAYKALVSVEYSGDTLLLGWNVRFRKGGRTLLRLYPKRGYFTVLAVVGRREKERFEALLPELSPGMRAVYSGTREGMGQRWLLLDLYDGGTLYEDVLRLVEIRRES